VKDGELILHEDHYLFYPEKKAFDAQTLRDIANEMDILGKRAKIINEFKVKLST